MKRIRHGLYYAIITFCALAAAVAGLAYIGAEAIKPAAAYAGAGASAGSMSLIAEFSTYYGDSAANRKHNVELAVSSIDGLTVGSGEVLSFNEAVGARTAERGYKEARVIKSGEYVEGIGGGVCQVSSTLYNAWALSGLKVEEVHCHTLPSNYVGISRDAAVSEYKDLKLFNDSGSEAYISAAADGEDIVIAVYGVSTGASYSIMTEIVSEIEPKEIEVVEVESDGTEATYEVVHGRNGYHARAFLVKTEPDGTQTKTQIRDDWYSPVKHRIIKRVPKSQTR